MGRAPVADLVFLGGKELSHTTCSLPTGNLVRSCLRCQELPPALAVAESVEHLPAGQLQRAEPRCGQAPARFCASACAMTAEAAPTSPVESACSDSRTAQKPSAAGSHTHRARRRHHPARRTPAFSHRHGLGLTQTETTVIGSPMFEPTEKNPRSSRSTHVQRDRRYNRYPGPFVKIGTDSRTGTRLLMT
jgi:hypothetical protein